MQQNTAFHLITDGHIERTGVTMEQTPLMLSENPIIAICFYLS